MKIGFITGDDFFKTSSQYVARQVAEKLVASQHEVYIFNKTNFSVELPHTKTIKVESVLNKLFSKDLFEQRTIKNLLRQNNIGKLLFFEPGDIVKTEIPSVLILNQEPPTESAVLQRMTMMQHIITFSHTQQQKLVYVLPEIEGKISVSRMPVEVFSNFSYNDRLAAKEQFANEKEYFVFTDFEIDQEKILNLLKAFSAFKKMQQTNWKLVVYLRARFTTKALDETLQPLSNFKYRTDVNIINNRNDSTLAECIAGAYAHISTDEKSIFNIPVFEALCAGVPSVAVRSEVTTKYPDAVLEMNNNSAEAIAEQMMLLYKNENLRSRLSQKAEEQTREFNRHLNLDELADLVTK